MNFEIAYCIVMDILLNNLAFCGAVQFNSQFSSVDTRLFPILLIPLFFTYYIPGHLKYYRQQQSI